MAHAKAVTRKKNFDDTSPDSPHHTPITGEPRRSNDEDYEDTVAAPPPKKKKKLRPPTAISGSSAANDDASDSNTSGSVSQEIEIVFKLHPSVVDEDPVVDKQNAIRFIKTTSKALVEHLCKYLAMRIALDLANKKPDSGPASTSSGGGSGDQSSVKDLTIYISNLGGPMTALSPNLSLTQVSEKHWKANKPMEMFYSFKRI